MYSGETYDFRGSLLQRLGISRFVDKSNDVSNQWPRDAATDKVSISKGDQADAIVLNMPEKRPFFIDPYFRSDIVLLSKVQEQEAVYFSHFAYGEGQVYVLAELSLWQNAYIAADDNAYFFGFAKGYDYLSIIDHVADKNLWDVLLDIAVECLVISFVLLILFLWHQGIRLVQFFLYHLHYKTDLSDPYSGDG